MLISMTTIPSRLPHIKPCIDSLEQQGLPTLVSVPREVERTGEVFDATLPDFLTEPDWLTVEVVPGRGPITKLLPALERGEKTIITADDDVIYGKGWADNLIKWSSLLPGAALCYRGRVLNAGNYNDSKIITTDGVDAMEVDFITSTWGALYRKDFFLPSLWEEWKAYPMNDDIVVSAHLKHRDIPMLVIPKLASITPYEVSEINALWDYNIDHNDEGLAELFWCS